MSRSVPRGTFTKKEEQCSTWNKERITKQNKEIAKQGNGREGEAEQAEKGEAIAFSKKKEGKRGRRKIREKKKAVKKNKATATNKPETPQNCSKINALKIAIFRARVGRCTDGAKIGAYKKVTFSESQKTRKGNFSSYETLFL